MSRPMVTRVKPASSKNRPKAAQDSSLQMDFFSRIPEPARPMAPMEPGPDGTPPLPLIHQPEPTPPRSVFPEEPSESTPDETDEKPTGTIMTEDTKDDLFDSDPFFNPAPSPIPPAPRTTAEERLLNTIVGESPSAAQDQARLDFQILKTRFSTLESDLAAARGEAASAHHMRIQAEARHAEAEKQWTDKLAQLRGMLEEVEDIRDELASKRVPRILFTGTLVAGIIATAGAYFLGSSRSTPDQPDTPTPPAPAIAAPVIRPLPVPATPPPTLWPVLEGSRWTTSQTGHELKVIFSYGTFIRGVELSPDAKQDLRAIASAIKAKGNHFRIEVEGHTDAAKAGAGKAHGNNNQALGLARARAAASYLVKQGGIPASLITTTSAGDSNPPYPNTTTENQKKNRTVILKITASSARLP